MADMTTDYYHYHNGLGDVRREIAKESAEIRADTNRGFDRTNDAVKSTGWQVSEKVSSEADRLAAIANQNFIATQDKFFALQKDILEAKQEVIAVTQREGSATRDLINSTTVADLRMEVLNARNQAERCVPRCCVSEGPGNSGK